MRALNRYLSFEMIAIHVLTGALFAFVNVLLFAVVVSRNPLFLPVLLPVAAFSWWGWWAEAKVVRNAARALTGNAGRS